MQAHLEILAIAAVIAVACALPGTLLVLRRMALLSDAISHSILLGIVLAFFAQGGLDSPLVILGAAASGVLMVVLVEFLVRSRLVREDAAIGLVFPVLFSIAVILVSRHTGSIHLDVDAVLLGELAFAPFDRLEAGGADLGPRGLWIGTGILALNLAFLGLCYKELKLSTFDAGLAAVLGFMPGVLHYGLLSLVSLTCVGAFDAVGSILVVALMIAPPATARLLTERLGLLFALSAALAVAGALLGYGLAVFLDLNIAGSMATVLGLFFALTWLAAPREGWLARRALRRAQTRRLAGDLLVIHLLQHEGSPTERREARVIHMQEHLGWSPEFARGVLADALEEGHVTRMDGLLHLKPEGRQRAEKALVHI